MQEITDILKTLDWSPLYISLKTGVVATMLSFFLGIWAASAVMRMGPRRKALLDVFLTLPMVLPPTVAGFFLLLIFSKRRPAGLFLYESFGIKVVQTWLGCILAATVISLPLMYRNARAAFEQVDVDLIYAGRTLGMSEQAIFGAGDCVRYDSYLRQSYGRIWCDFYAGREYSGENSNRIAEDCHGHSGW